MTMPVLSRLTLGVSMFILGACSTFEGPEFQKLSEDYVLARVKMVDRAIIVAVGDTVDVEVNAMAADKQSLSLADARLVWLSQDSSIFSVTQTGKIIAKKATALSVNVVVKMTYGLVTKADTIPVFVTATRINATTGKLTALDSNRVGLDGIGLFGFPRVRLDLYRGDTLVSRGARIALGTPRAITLEYQVSTDTAVGNVYLVKNTGNQIGKFWIFGRLNLYGTRISDSLLFVGTYPASTFLFFSKDPITNKWSSGIEPNAPAMMLQPCGYFQVFNFSGSPMDVVFSDSIATPTGCRDQVVVGPSVNQVGGNLLALQSPALRRSNSSGEVETWLRIPGTRDLIPVHMRVFYKHVE